MMKSIHSRPLAVNGYHRDMVPSYSDGSTAQRKMITAILNRPTRALEKCELTFLERDLIQFEIALQQHAEYAKALREMGVHVELLEVNPASPDAVFVEDTAIILDEVAVITSMGSERRRKETDAMANIVRRFRHDVQRISVPVTIEGGDVLAVGRTLFVGESPRTNAAGICELKKIVGPLGYVVRSVQVCGCLHLKTGITALDDATLVCNSNWIDISPFAGYRLIHEGFSATTATHGPHRLRSWRPPSI